MARAGDPGHPANDVNTPAGSTTNANCIKLAYERYRLNMDLAKRNCELCAAAVLTTLGTAIIGCAVALAPAPLAVFVCVLLALATADFAMAACLFVYAVAVQNLEANLKLDLRACGMNILDV